MPIMNNKDLGLIYDNYNNNCDTSTHRVSIQKLQKIYRPKSQIKQSVDSSVNNQNIIYPRSYSQKGNSKPASMEYNFRNTIIKNLVKTMKKLKKALPIDNSQQPIQNSQSPFYNNIDSFNDQPQLNIQQLAYFQPAFPNNQQQQQKFQLQNEKQINQSILIKVNQYHNNNQLLTQRMLKSFFSKKCQIIAEEFKKNKPLQIKSDQLNLKCDEQQNDNSDNNQRSYWLSKKNSELIVANNEDNNSQFGQHRQNSSTIIEQNYYNKIQQKQKGRFLSLTQKNNISDVNKSPARIIHQDISKQVTNKLYSSYYNGHSLKTKKNNYISPQPNAISLIIKNSKEHFKQKTCSSGFYHQPGPQFDDSHLSQTTTAETQQQINHQRSLSNSLQLQISNSGLHKQKQQIKTDRNCNNQEDSTKLQVNQETNKTQPFGDSQMLTKTGREIIHQKQKQTTQQIIKSQMMNSQNKLELFQIISKCWERNKKSKQIK